MARGAAPEEVFAAVAEEVGRLLDVDLTAMSRYDPDGVVTGVGVWSRPAPARPLAVGTAASAGRT